jgi:hypothetical protein
MFPAERRRSSTVERVPTHEEKCHATRRQVEAERRAWATGNKETGGGNKSGSGRGVPDTNVAARKGGRIGGKKSASRPAAARSASARKAAATRKRHEHHASR